MFFMRNINVYDPFINKTYIYHKHIYHNRVNEKIINVGTRCFEKVESWL